MSGAAALNQLYWDKCVTLNPFTARRLFSVEEVCSAADVLPLPQFVETPFYRMIRLGMVRRAVGQFQVADQPRGVFVARAARLVDDEMRRAPAGYVALGHDRQADQSQPIEAAAIAVRSMGCRPACSWSMPPGIGAPMADVLNGGNVLHASGRPVAPEIHADKCWATFVPPAMAMRRSPGVAAARRATATVVTHVLPLTSGIRRQAGLSYAAVAAVFVQKAGQSPSPAVQTLAEQYDLTAAELLVLVALTDFGGVAEVAAALKLSPATVRTHLRHVFEKTGVRRQADLIKLVASYPAPILAQRANGMPA